MDVKYVVRGALVKCNKGEKATRLNLPKSHGVYVNEKPVLIATDAMPEVNVMSFGKCKICKKCKLALAPRWEKTQSDVLISGQTALITKSVLSCAVGGEITIKNDGQLG